MNAIWRQAIADRPGTCIQCGQRIETGDSVGFAKGGDGRWIRAHEQCIPARERTQTAFPGPIPTPPEEVPELGLKSMEDRIDSVETSLISIAASLNKIAKDIHHTNDLLEAIENLMRR